MDVVHTNFSKAFDVPDNCFAKCIVLVLPAPFKLIAWIKSYLSARIQRELFNSYMSRSMQIVSGVPQGSHLGPLLFHLPVNGLPPCLHPSKVVAFQDDVKLTYPFHNFEDDKWLRSDLCEFYTGCKRNGMFFIFKNCKHLTFCREVSIVIDYYTSEQTMDGVLNFGDLRVIVNRKFKIFKCTFN